jgi:hypothetical protein
VSEEKLNFLIAKEQQRFEKLKQLTLNTFTSAIPKNQETVKTRNEVSTLMISIDRASKMFDKILLSFKEVILHVDSKLVQGKDIILI